jgi:hypothetical protein
VSIKLHHGGASLLLQQPQHALDAGIKTLTMAICVADRLNVRTRDVRSAGVY